MIVILSVYLTLGMAIWIALLARIMTVVVISEFRFQFTNRGRTNWSALDRTVKHMPESISNIIMIPFQPINLSEPLEGRPKLFYGSWIDLIKYSVAASFFYAIPITLAILYYSHPNFDYYNLVNSIQMASILDPDISVLRPIVEALLSFMVDMFTSIKFWLVVFLISLAAGYIFIKLK